MATVEMDDLLYRHTAAALNPISWANTLQLQLWLGDEDSNLG
jgi:hypothetical protein